MLVLHAQRLPFDRLYALKERHGLVVAAMLPQCFR
jgi:hypothetical protein